MTTRRCPTCGGLVGADAEWCSQCLTKLDRTAPVRQEAPPPPDQAPDPVVDAPPEFPAETADGPPPPPPASPPSSVGGAPSPRSGAAGRSGVGVRATGQGIVWLCPTCDSENPIEATSCRTCGTPFGRLLEEGDARPRADPGRAVAFSLLFPGLGHFVTGRGAEGVARAVIFAYAAASAVTILVATGGSPGPFLSLVAASVVVAVGLYAVSAMDAARAARGEPPLLGSRILLYGGAGLILLTVVVLLVAGFRASGRPPG